MTSAVVVIEAVSCSAYPPLATAVVRSAMRLPLASPRFFRMWAIGSAVGTACTLLTGEWPLAAAYGASGLVALVLWWHSRRKRRKVAKLIGEKARAVLAKMARSMPRTSPRLVPQGARA